MVASFSLRVGYWKLFLSGFSTGPSSSINSRIATGERLRDSRKRTQRGTTSSTPPSTRRSP